MDMILKSFGSKVRAERQRIGLSQEELAYRCGLHRTYIGGVERGERNIGLINLVRIACALGIEPDELIRKLGKDEKR